MSISHLFANLGPNPERGKKEDKKNEWKGIDRLKIEETKNITQKTVNPYSTHAASTAGLFPLFIPPCYFHSTIE